MQAVLDTWNAQKAKGRWKTHRSLLPDIKKAIRFNIKEGWTLEDMCESIENYGTVLTGKQYKWDWDKWTLAQYLTRGVRDNDLRWVWFHPNNFREEDWLTEKAFKAKKAVRPQPAPEPTDQWVLYKNMSNNSLQKQWDMYPFLHGIIRKVRPDFEPKKT